MIAGDTGPADQGADDSGVRSGYVAAECENCSRRFRLRGWREGVKCPGCEGGRLAPLVADGGAVDYCIADRSRGYAQPDIRFAQWAKWAELISPRQYELAFIKQQRYLQTEEQPPPIHRVMVEEGWLTEKQAIGLLEFMCKKRPDRDDERFAGAVLRADLAEEEDVRKARKLQEKISGKANETPALCQVMLEKRILSETRTESVLRRLQDMGMGSLASVSEVLKGPARTGGKGAGLQKTLAENSHILKYGAIVAVLFLVAAVVWRWQVYESPDRFLTVCDSCEQVSELVWSPHVPLECPECRERSAFPARICSQGHIFASRNPYHTAPCPECGTTEVRALEKEDPEG